MSYEILTRSPALQKQLKTYAKALLNDNATGRAAYRPAGHMLLRNGISSNVETYIIPIPHGRDTDEACKEVEECVQTFFDFQGLESLFVTTTSPRPIIANALIIGAWAIEPTAVSIVVDIRGLKSMTADLLAHLKDVFPDQDLPMVRRMRLNPSNGTIVTRPETIAMQPPLENVLALYPYMDQTPAQVWEAFKASKSNVLLLIGPPGTGKSSFVLGILRARGWDKPTYLGDQQNVLLSPALPDYIRDRPGESLIITEDSDELVAKRTEGNSLMSALLNSTAGIVSNNTKLIISTNLESLKHVDEALIRPGRTFRIITFRALEGDEPNAARAALGLPVVDLPHLNGGWSLADALNYDEAGGEVRKAPAVGFSR